MSAAGASVSGSILSGSSVHGAEPNRRPNQRWAFEESHPEEAAALAKAAHLPQVLAELLIARGITDPDAAFQFLNPEISHLHDPQLMLGMSTAAAK